ncbi:MAG: ROK family protein [Pyrinomonadaceae bacterium]|nr:ROK family protein [Pyrinomonadaceae bacterium]
MTEQNKKLIGIEVANNLLRAVCLDESGNLIDSSEFSTNPEIDLTSQIIDFIHAIETKFGNFQKVGIAVSGLVDRRTNRVALSMQIPTDKDLANEIKNATGLEIFLENDANSAAYGEFVQGAGRGNKDMFYVLLSQGVGGALILDGKLWRGNAGFAGEFGHLAINSEGMKIEEMASEQGILRRTRNRFHQDNTSSLYEIGEENITIADIVRESQNGDDLANLMLQRTGIFLGKAIASVINLLNIEKIVVGGEIMQASEIVLQGINESAGEFAFAPSYESTQIVANELGDNSIAIGVALLSE